MINARRFVLTLAVLFCGVSIAFAGGVFTLSNGLSIDASGNILINAAGGAANSITSFGFPLDSSGNLMVDCTLGCGGATLTCTPPLQCPSSTINFATTTPTGYVLTGVNGLQPIFSATSSIDGPSSPVSTTPYPIACDTTTGIVDRGKTIKFTSGASVVTVPLSTTAGSVCSGLYVTAVDVSAGTLTFNASSPDVFTVVNGLTALTSQTSFTIANGQYVRLSNNSSGQWLVLIATGNANQINGVSLAGLSTGIVKNTTGTGAPSIAVAADLPGSGATTVNGQTCTLGSPCTIPLSAENPQTTTYQVLLSDFSNYKTIAVSSGTFTITLVASGTPPPAGQYIKIVNYGSGVVTVARSGQNINNAAANLTLAASSAAAPSSVTVESDGTNYTADSHSLNATSLIGKTWAVPANIGTGTPGTVTATNLLLNAQVLSESSTAPTISSGFGTSPSVSANNGTPAFRVNVGTGGVATSGVIGLPAATTGWNCFCTDITTNSTGVFSCKQTASSTTTATVGNFSDVAVATAWTASDILAVSCFAY
jgi:hypothetical protein